MLRSRIVSAPGDKQGVLFFHTRESRGLDDAPGGLSVREGVYVDQRMSIPSARRIQHLADLVGPEGNARFRAKVGCGPAPDPDDGYYDALLKAHHVAREMLNDHPPGARVAKRALLLLQTATTRADRAKTVENSSTSNGEGFRDASTASTCDSSPSHARARATIFEALAVTTSPRGCWVCARWDETTRTRRTPTPSRDVREFDPWALFTATRSEQGQEAATTRTTTCHARRRSRLTTRTFAPRTFARHTSTATRWWRVPRIAWSV